jgi:HAD superfamily hydrolase (TIGR01549 family)
MIQAVLFDLDGTLLQNDMDRFMRHYLRALSARVVSFMPPARFVECLMAGTERMSANTHPTITNKDAFWRAFEELSGHAEGELRPVVDEFYVQEFGKLSECTQRIPEARPLVEEVMKSGRATVIATAPLFPLRAIQHRMDWAGVADLPFTLVTSYENMHYSKPYKEYFQEIANLIGVPPESCLMVGDDRRMDASSAEVGMRFFWITAEEPFGETQGNLAHVHDLVRDGWLDA